MIYKPYLFAEFINKSLFSAIPTNYDPVKAQQKIEQLELLTDKDLESMKEFGMTKEDLIAEQKYINQKEKEKWEARQQEEAQKNEPAAEAQDEPEVIVDL
jgi:hypothetical protein